MAPVSLAIHHRPHHHRSITVLSHHLSQPHPALPPLPSQRHGGFLQRKTARRLFNRHCRYPRRCPRGHRALQDICVPRRHMRHTRLLRAHREVQLLFDLRILRRNGGSGMSSLREVGMCRPRLGPRLGPSVCSMLSRRRLRSSVRRHLDRLRRGRREGLSRRVSNSTNYLFSFPPFSSSYFLSPSYLFFLNFLSLPFPAHRHRYPYDFSFTPTLALY